MDKKAYFSKFIGWVYIYMHRAFFSDQGAEKNHTTARISDFTDQKTKQDFIAKNHPSSLL